MITNFIQLKTIILPESCNWAQLLKFTCFLGFYIYSGEFRICRIQLNTRPSHIAHYHNQHLRQLLSNFPSIPHLCTTTQSKMNLVPQRHIEYLWWWQCKSSAVYPLHSDAHYPRVSGAWGVDWSVSGEVGIEDKEEE